MLEQAINQSQSRNTLHPARRVQMPTSGWMSLLSIFALFYLALLIKIYHNFRNFEARGIWTWSTSNSYKNIGVKRATLVPVTMQHFKTSASTRHLILPKRITPATQFSRFRREPSWPRNRTVTSRVWYSGSCDRIWKGYNKTSRPYPDLGVIGAPDL